MHIEILTEDNSGQRLLEHLMPELIGQMASLIRGAPMHTAGSVAFRKTYRHRLIPRSVSCWIKSVVCCAATPRLPLLMRSWLCSIPMFVTARNFSASYDRSPYRVTLRTSLCSGWRLRRWKLGTSVTAPRCSAPILRPRCGRWTATCRTPSVGLGNWSRKPSILAARVRSIESDGPCLDRPSMDGPIGSGRCLTPRSTRLPASANCETEYGGWPPRRPRVIPLPSEQPIAEWIIQGCSAITVTQTEI